MLASIPSGRSLRTHASKEIRAKERQEKEEQRRKMNRKQKAERGEVN
jgi:hypothetical protein